MSIVTDIHISENEIHSKIMIISYVYAERMRVHISDSHRMKHYR